MASRQTFEPSSAPRLAGRSFLLDLLKAIGCILIVLHHLAFYGPMSDVVAQRWPIVMDWLVDHGRLAVQFFLVCSGYLTASAFARGPQLDARRLLGLVWRRYLRLAVPLLAALSITVVVTEMLRPLFDHASLSGTPAWPQVLAHVFLLQHLMNLEALSAGVWYVAIDFQLYLLALLVLWAVGLWQRRRPTANADALRTQAILALTVFSLLHWNLDAELDMFGLYFFGSYGLGWLAWRARQSRLAPKGWTILLALGLLALWVDPRWRIATAWLVALLLAVAPAAWLGPLKGHGRWRAAVSGLARISYSVFVIHFAVSLLVNAAVTHGWPQSPGWNAAGMVLALGLSLLAGVLLNRWTERKDLDWRHGLAGAGVFIASAGLAMLLRGASA